MKNIIRLFIFFISVSSMAQHSSRPVEYVMIEVPPVYQGCETEKTPANKRACSSKKLTSHIDKNFDFTVSQKTNLPEGQYNIYVSFIIDLEGNITEVKTKGNDFKPFIEEATRLVKSIPKYSSPGIQKGKKVKVRFTLPIAFIVEKEEK